MRRHLLLPACSLVLFAGVTTLTRGIWVPIPGPTSNAVMLSVWWLFFVLMGWALVHGILLIRHRPSASGPWASWVLAAGLLGLTLSQLM